MKRVFGFLHFVLVAPALSLLLACGNAGSDSSNSGGADTAGGSSATGGSTATGGSGVTGGSTATGGNATGGSSVGGADPELFNQAPHCPTGTSGLFIEGSLDGSAILDDRTDPFGINAGFSNGPNGHFDTPPAGSLPLQAGQVELHFQWGPAVAYGQSAAVTGGTLLAPAPHPLAGQPLCVTQGKLGFPEGGNESHGFKFKISEVRKGADCSGALVPVDLRGCMPHL